MSEDPSEFHSFVRDGGGWETVRRDLKYANPYLQVYLAEMRTPLRPQGARWTVVHRKGAVVIAPVMADGRLLLVHQERIPIRAAIWEFPAGQIDSAAEDDDAAIRAVARRELREETGYELAADGELIPMGHFFPSPGFTDEHSHLFLARGVTPSPLGPHYDENELIRECRAFTPEEFRAMIARGEIRDANTLSTFARMSVLGLIYKMARNIFKFREEGNPDAVKPFLEHLEDLRWMLAKIAATLVIGMVASFFFREQLVAIVQHPLRQVDPHLLAELQVLSPVDPIMIVFELSFYASLVLTFPINLYFLAGFVLPALSERERRFVLPGIGVCMLLFLGGVSFCYFVILPKTLAFFFGFTTSLDWTPRWQVREYFGFVTQITLAFGVCFELPVAVLALVYMRMLTSPFLRRTRPYAFVIILAVAIIVAPTPDIITFLSLGIPMCLLYEVCIWLGWLVERWRAKKEALAAR